MSKTRVVNCLSQKWDYRIDRSSPLGNPFILDRDGSRVEVIEKYEEYFKDLIKQPAIMGLLCQLVGKRLGCWCKPAPCHGDVIVRYINSLFEADEV